MADEIQKAHIAQTSGAVGQIKKTGTDKPVEVPKQKITLNLNGQVISGTQNELAQKIANTPFGNTLTKTGVKPTSTNGNAGVSSPQTEDKSGATKNITINFNGKQISGAPEDVAGQFVTESNANVSAPQDTNPFENNAQNGTVQDQSVYAVAVDAAAGTNVPIATAVGETKKLVSDGERQRGAAVVDVTQGGMPVENLDNGALDKAISDAKAGKVTPETVATLNNAKKTAANVGTARQELAGAANPAALKDAEKYLAAAMSGTSFRSKLTGISKTADKTKLAKVENSSESGSTSTD